MLLLLTLAVAPVKVCTIPLADLVARCPLILVGRVERIAETPHDGKVAVVTVVGVVKGDKTLESVYVLASRLWTCDASGAVAGETALLFLSDGPGLDLKDGLVDAAREFVGPAPLYFEAHAGRGRMPIHEGSADLHVAALGDIDEVRAWPSTCKACTLPHQCPLADVLANVHRILDEQAEAVAPAPR
ncbi:MAG TPA: hypothetical protein VFY71_11255 [Planctomycetota bacterium]|nr:hypothetical protein [Planctomycetota bacterium]